MPSENIKSYCSLAKPPRRSKVERFQELEGQSYSVLKFEVEMWTLVKVGGCKLDFTLLYIATPHVVVCTQVQPAKPCYYSGISYPHAVSPPLNACRHSQQTREVKRGAMEIKVDEEAAEAVAPAPSRFRRICVFCGSSHGKKRSYQDAAIELGKELVNSVLLLLTLIPLGLFVRLPFICLVS